MTKIVSVRLTPLQWRKLQRQARASGNTHSGVLQSYVDTLDADPLPWAEILKEARQRAASNQAAGRKPRPNRVMEMRKRRNHHAHVR